MGQLGYGYKGGSIGDEPGEMDDNLNPLNFGSEFDLKDVALGQSHSCVLAMSGKIKCFGWNNWGECGYGTRSDTLLIGDNLSYVDLGTSFNVTSLVTGSTAYHSCAISVQNEVKCWGRNDWGQLGIGDTNARGYKLDQMGDNLPNIVISIPTESM